MILFSAWMVAGIGCVDKRRFIPWPSSLRAAQCYTCSLILNFAWIHDMGLNVRLQTSSFEEEAPRVF